MRSPGRRRGRKRQCRDVYYHSQDSDNSDSENRLVGGVSEGVWSNSECELS